MRGQKLIQAKHRYQKIRRVCWLLFIGVSAALLLSLLAIYLLSQGPRKGRQLVTRSSEETFVSLGGEVPVKLLIEPAATEVKVPAGGWNLDVLIGLDNSLSTRPAFPTILEVGGALVGATDLTRHQIALARLDEDARVIQGLSRNRPVLERMVREFPKGRSTKVHGGLEAMGRELASIRRQAGGLGLVILLTDGRTNAEAAKQAAEELKGQPRVFIAPIGIGDAVDDDLLRAISSFPGEYQKATEVAELTSIYEGWIRKIEQLVAVDVRVEENFNTAGLTLSATNAPGATVTGNQVVWEIPFLTTAPRSLHYTPEAAALGWYGIDEPQGKVSLQPVVGEPIERPIHRKPKVLVGTLLLWLLLLLLPLLFLVPWLIAWWRRRQAAAGPALLPEELAEPEPGRIPDPLPALDLDALIRPTEPTLVIGLGGTGRWALTYLKKAVLETNYGRVPGTVRFLLFDTHEAELEEGAEAVRVGGVELDEGEYVLLHEDPAHPAEVHERTRRMCDEPEPEAEPHLRDWWPAEELAKLPREQLQISRGTNQRRPLGRMALFLDLEDGVDESRFWSSVREAILAVTADGGDPTVFIAASAAGGTGSALAVDAAYVTRKICQCEELTGVTINLLLALQNSFACLGDQLGLTGPNAFATLRELDRFLACREQRFPMVYSADGASPADGRPDSPLVDNCFVFDAEREVRPLIDVHPKRGIFPAMADVIHTFLYTTPGGAFDHELRQHKAVAELEREQSGHGVVSSLGTFVFRLPMYEFFQSFKYRFARELLAELVGAERDGEGRWVVPAPSAEQQATLDLDLELDEFLRRAGAERTPPDVLGTVAEGDPEMLVAILEADRAHKAEDEYVRLHVQNGRRYLAGYWIERLHGDAEAESEEKPGRFPGTLYVAEQLQCRLEIFREQARGLGGGSARRMTEALIAGYQRAVADVLERLAAYRDVFADPGSLLAALDDAEARQRLVRQFETDLVVREYFYDETLEERIYQDHLGEEIRRRILQQFVWQCREAGDRLTPELEVTTTEPRSMPAQDAGSEPVTELAELILQPIWDQEVTPYVVESHPSPQALAEKICEWAAPLVAFDRTKAVRHTSKLFTTLGDDAYGEEVAEHIYPKFARRQHVRRTPFRDPHCLSNVMVLDSLPLPALRPYDESARGYHAYREGGCSQLHVFAAERRAVELERELPEIREPWRVFHPRFIGELEEPERLRLFAECAI